MCVFFFALSFSLLLYGFLIWTVQMKYIYSLTHILLSIYVRSYEGNDKEKKNNNCERREGTKRANEKKRKWQHQNDIPIKM